MKSPRSAVAAALIGALALGGCGSDDDVVASDGVVRQTITVGRTTEPISQLLAEIYGQGLENSGFGVGRKDPVADRAATLAALADDRVQFVPELSAALLAHVTSAAGTVNAALTVDEQLAALKLELPTLAAGPATSAAATTVVACSQAIVAEHSLSNVSSLAAVADQVAVGGSAAFESAESFGLAALNTVYDTEFDYTVIADAGFSDQVSTRLADGSIGCVIASQMLAAITIDGLIVLADDKTALPADMIIPLMTIAAAGPDVQAVITQINTSITTDVLRALLVKASLSGDSYAVIAGQFLTSLSQGEQ